MPPRQTTTTVKIAVTSDLYFPVTPRDRLMAMAQEMEAFGPDVAVLAGDLAESLEDLTACLRLFRQGLSCPIWVLPGDHDFWARPPYDSQRLWQQLLPQTVAAQGCQWLEGQAFVVNDDSGIAVAGSIAWYDYSAACMGGMVSDLEFAQQKYLYNADALRIDWEWSDTEFAGQVGGKLLVTLDHLEQDAGIRQTVVITHFPILEEQLNRRPGTGLASAYAGNLSLGKKVLACGKVSHVISGHAHVDRHCQIQRDEGRLADVEVHALPGDYDKPAWRGISIET